MSIDGLYRAMGKPGRDANQPAFCDACFTGDYPISLDDQWASRTASFRCSPNRPEASLMTAAAAGRLSGRLALITGASRGLGAAAALAYAREGAHCVLVARTVGGLEAVDDQIKALGGSATLVPLDVTDGPGIDRLGAALYERFGRLDVLLGNAGILGTLSPVGHIEPAVFERVMAVNVTANWRLIRSLDPLLRQSDAGRAIFVTSGVSRRVDALLGRLCRQQGGARHAGRHLCRRDRPHRGARQSVQSRPDAHRHARARPSRARIRPSRRRPRRMPRR